MAWQANYHEILSWKCMLASTEFSQISSKHQVDETHEYIHVHILHTDLEYNFSNMSPQVFWGSKFEFSSSIIKQNY